MTPSSDSARSAPALPLQPIRRAGWFWRIAQFPLTRLVMLLVALLLAQSLTFAAAAFISNREPNPLQQPILMLAIIGVAAMVYAALTRLIERRRVSELAPEHAIAETGIGVLIGFGAISATVLLMWLSGVYRVTAVNNPSALITSLVIGILPGITEEIVFRGVLYRIIEGSWGTWAALVITSLLFGAVHLANPNASWFAALAIALEAGLMLGIAYTRTQRLWLPIGIHFAWNWAQGGVYGVPVSGLNVDGLLAAEVGGPELLAGGGFGAEATVFAIAVCLLIFLVLTIDAYRRNRVILPFWLRPGASTMEQSPDTSA